MSATPPPSPASPSWRTRVGSVVFWISSALLALIALLAFVTVFPAGANVVTLFGSMVWSLVGPTLVVLAVVAAAIALTLAFRGRRRARFVVAGIAVVALVWPVAITATIAGAAQANGGSVDLLAAATLSGADTEPTRTEVYSTVDGEELHAVVLAPEGSPADAPVLMYIHGGGWIGGSAETDYTLASGYADLGYYVVAVDYRLATAEHPTWDEAPADVACALAWTAQAAAADGADTDRLVIAGDSAGGNLALVLGWSAAQGEIASTCPELGPVPVPDAIVAGYPVADPADAYDNGRPWFGPDPKGFTEDYLGGTPSEHPERLAAISPVTYLSPEAPATLVVQPEDDDFIPASGNDAVAERAREAGVDITVIPVPLAHHAFDFLPGGLGWQVKTTVVDHWLEEQGLAPAPQ